MAKIQINTTYLNHDWQYKKDFKESYLKSFTGDETVHIPHTNIELPYNNFSEKMYQFISSYQKKFTFQKQKNKRYVLHFDGVMIYAEVYLNNSLIMTHKGGYTPFSKDITKELKNGENKLFVMVDSTERKDIPPHGFVVDYLTYGGIYREVYIEEHEQNFIQNALIHVENDTLHTRLFLDVTSQENTVFHFNIYNEQKELVYFFEREYDLKKTDIFVTESVLLDEWDLDHPTLYTLEIIMNNQVSYVSRFANRQIKLTEEGFFLNNKHIKLIGLNRHQAYPYVGYAMPSTQQKKDADILKYELGCNTVRSSHYPPSKHFLNRCDEIGLLVFNEIPGWQHIGNQEWQDVAIQNVKEMITRDYNHPSIFIWGVRINESPDNDDFYKKTNNMAKSLDTSRPTGGVRNFAGSHIYEDVYTYNDFVHRGTNEGIVTPKKISKKQMPYLVTEFNGHMYPTKKFDDEFHREYQVKRHLNVQNDSFKTKELAGAIGWCMFDYNTHKDFGSGDRICYHGVLDMFRIPKDAASVYASTGRKEPYMHIASNLNIGEREASEIKEVYIMTNVDYVKCYLNNELLGEYYPSDRYNYLPHPPIIIDDFIGNLIHKNESFTDKDATLVKEILLYIMRYGMRLPFTLKMKLKYILFKYKMTIDQAQKLYETYVGKWGLESIEYTFEGIKDGITVIKQIKGSTYENDLYVYPDDLTLTETETYEVTRIVVKHQDSNLNHLLYSNETITVSVDGPLQLIGPNTLSLIGGSIGLYFKTIGETGNATITISSNYYQDKIVEIKVLEKPVTK
jgi:beta-galactosidase